MNPPACAAPVAGPAVLFVCMGNICRSPTAEGLFRHLAPRLAPGVVFKVDSAGTHGYHLGAPPDERSQRAALERGVDLSSLRARRIQPHDLEHFDWIVSMDERNRRDVLALVGSGDRPRLVRLLDFAPGEALRDVPDPYYGVAADFTRVSVLIESGVRGLIGALAGAAGHPA